jgi:ABC-2 type transport system ATP-binding protein
MPAIAVDGLRKTYGEHAAVDDVSFAVEPGEVFALLGPNGAGKTTTLEICEGFRPRDGGRVDVLGFDPAHRLTTRAMRERIGIVLQECAVEPYLSVREVLIRNAGYYPHPSDIDEVIGLVGLTEKADERVKKLSGGQQRRLDVGLGIVGDPELLFLDEPTTGFDPSARRGSWDMVRKLTGSGTTVILTTHYMDEAQALADRVAIIAGGRIVAVGTPDELGGRDAEAARIRFGLPAGVAVADLPLPAAVEGEAVEIRSYDETRALHALTGWAIDAGVTLDGLTVTRPSLEEIYLRLTGSVAETAQSPAEPEGVPA